MRTTWYPYLPKVIIGLLACATIGLTQVRHDTFIAVTNHDSVDAVYFYPRSSPPPSGYPAILDVHGFGLTKDTEIPFCTTYAAKGYVTLAYTVRGHGVSSGLSSIMSTNERKDLAHVLAFLRSLQSVDSNNVGIIGSSQGGLHGLWAAADQLPVKAVVSDAIVPAWATDLFANGCIRRTALNLLKTAQVRWSPVRDTLWEFVRQDLYDSLLSLFPRGRDVDESGLSVSPIPLMTFLKWQDHYFSPVNGINSFMEQNSPKSLYVGTQGHWSDLSVPEWLFQSEQLSRWFQQFLKGIPSGILDEPEYTFSSSSLPMDSMGYFSWTRNYSAAWPPAGTELFRFYLHADSVISISPPSAAVDSFRVENKYLNPSYTFDTAFAEGFKGPRFDILMPKSTLAFISPLLWEEVLWIGAPKMRLYVRSDYDKFPLHAQIYEVDSAGNKYFINRINLTARHWAPGSGSWIEAEGIAHAHTFSPGSRIRIELTNIDKTNRKMLGDFPFVVPLLENTGVSVYSGPGIASYIELPMIGDPTHVGNDWNDKIRRPFLLTNYPNPLNSRTIISYSVPTKSHVSLKIYNTIGQVIATLADGIEDTGVKQMPWEASAYPSGIYFLRITISPLSGSSSSQLVRKIILLR